MDAWTIYWITRLPELKELVTPGFGIWLVGIILLVVGTALLMVDQEELVDNVKDGDDTSAPAFAFLMVKRNIRWTSWVVGVWIFVGSIVGVLLPNYKDMGVIAAATWATNSEEMSKLPDNVVRTLNKFMEEFAPVPAPKMEK
jgi:hypothetical protein